jgi:hypothetical protein
MSGSKARHSTLKACATSPGRLESLVWDSLLATIAIAILKHSCLFSHPGLIATEKAQIKNAKSKAMARKQPTAPAFEGFGFFFPRAALN